MLFIRKLISKLPHLNETKQRYSVKRVRKDQNTRNSAVSTGKFCDRQITRNSRMSTIMLQDIHNKKYLHALCLVVVDRYDFAPDKVNDSLCYHRVLITEFNFNTSSNSGRSVATGGSAWGITNWHKSSSGLLPSTLQVGDTFRSSLLPKQEAV